MSLKSGLSTKGDLFDSDGLAFSLVNSFTASAKGWGIPAIETLFGPFRDWW